jgi:hypothetical protein
MANGVSTDFVVKRRVRDGWYVYTCDTLPGLLVAGNDDRIAYEDVTNSIRMLLKLDHGVDCVVTHKVSYAEFFRNLRLKERATDAVKRRTADLMDDSDHIFFNVAQAVFDGSAA